MEALKKKRLAKRLTGFAVVLGFGSVAVALIAAVGTGQGTWDFRAGLSALRYALFAGIGGVIFALGALLAARRVANRLMFVNLLVLVVAGAFVLYVGNQVRIARSVPAIHDISTNLENWPRFYRLTVRADNLANIPDMGRPELAALPPR